MAQENDNDLRKLKEQLPHMDIFEVRRRLRSTNQQSEPDRYELLRDHLYDMEEIREGLLGKRQTPPQKYPRFANAIMLLLFLIAIQLAATYVMRWLLDRAGITITNPIDLAVAGIANLIAFFTVIIYGARRTEAPKKDVLLLRSFSPGMILPVVIAVTGISILGSEIDNLLRHLLPPPEAIQKIMQDIAQSGPWGIFTLVVVAPLTEELLFRGLLLRGFNRNYGAGAAVFVSAFLFAVIHLNPYQMLPAFFAGLFLGWITLGSKSVWPAIFAHASTNGLLIMVSWLNPDIPGLIQRGQPEYQPLWLDGTGVVLLIVGILWLGRLFHGKEAHKQ